MTASQINAAITPQARMRPGCAWAEYGGQISACHYV